MNIFSSKEVYKHVIADGEHKLIPVRGVYVASEYRPAYIVDNMISIVGIGNTPATIVQYTQTDTETYHDVVHTMNITVDSANAGIINYTRTDTTAYSDLISNMVINISSIDTDVTYYTKTNESCYDTPVTPDISIDDVSTDVYYISTNQRTSNDFVVQITGIYGNTATIT